MLRHTAQIIVIVMLATVFLIPVSPTILYAEESLEERIKRLEEEIRQLKAHEALEELPYEETGVEEGKISFHGYGEMHYNNPKTGATVPDGSNPAVMDFHRMVIGLSYQFSNRISLHTEVDFEHAARDIELEYAYLDFLITPAFNLRAGSMLMPVGPLNEFHEPTLFYSVERPNVETRIIPTTWQEGGAGAFGSLPGGVKYRLYGVSGLNAEGFSAASGIRGGREHVAEAPAEDLAIVGRLEYIGLPGIQAGGSFYAGGANTTKNSALGDSTVSILEGDLRFRKAGLDLRGVFVYLTVDDAERISAFTETGETIGQEMQGWYAEIAYDLLRVLLPRSAHSAVVFVRYEAFNTQMEVPTGFTRDPETDRNVVTAGLAYYPHPDVAIKADAERWEDETHDEGWSRWNLGIAYRF